MEEWYWWLRYGNFPPGRGNLPHMGKVIAFHRQKRYRTQAEFAIALGVDKRSVEEWEAAVFMHDQERRIMLVRMLKIAPALLGLDWRLVVYENNQGEHKDSLPRMVELIEEDAYYAYEDILVIGHHYIHNGGSSDIAPRIDRRLRKLVEITGQARATDQEAWKALLCRYYQLSTRIKQQCLLDAITASRHAQLAVELAEELQDAELIASAYVNSACTSTQQGQLDIARQAIAMAMTQMDKIRNAPLKGNIYLEAANINTPFALQDSKLQTQCKNWQTQALNLLYRGIEPDDNFFHFNLSAVHHERARSLLCWQKTRTDRSAAHDKLKLALETLTPDLNVWKAYYYMTEARLYLADHDIEGSAQAGKAALAVARAMHSKMEERNAAKLYTDLYKLAPDNPYVHNLGLQLGLFPA
ncbi:hypothetical protein EPA93_36480 [Ktedonosporobacter rubrisoli]|uniref:Uncharacterized protein n=1 Tax=Ktedonosporobacter rubrisoli TaxID=2509675 RepID=A0A4P6JZI9_KTERU|nr:hypothetical protein [Ktedonosporobacter rubrisoli]QBD81179.1 hypothetical protein EPA93_36480 [Ktedonosporobacter rubrisoli]